MNLTLVLAISVPFALASYVPLFTSAVSTNFLRRLTDREGETRAKLFYAAIDRLKDMRVSLEDFFKAYDAEENPLFLEARPRDLQGPVKEYLRYFNLQDRMKSALTVVERLSRIVFWFLVVFAVACTTTVILGVLSAGPIGLEWSTDLLAIDGVVFVIGGAIYLVMLIFARRVDAAHAVARNLGAASLTADAGVDD